MSVYFTSFTDTLHAAYQGGVDAMADPNTRFVFSCMREHVFRDDETTAPYEVSWVGDGESLFAPVSDDQVPAKAWATWTQLRDILVVADWEERIWWGAFRSTHGVGGEENVLVDTSGWEYEDRNMFGLRAHLTQAGHTVFGGRRVPA